MATISRSSTGFTGQSGKASRLVHGSIVTMLHRSTCGAMSQAERPAFLEESTWNGEMTAGVLIIPVFM
jgi:hypothetical protein